MKGHPLPSQNAFLAKFGDHTKAGWGSNAIIIRNFKGPEGIGPAASLQAGPYLGRFDDVMMQIHKFGDREEDTRLFLAPDVETLSLKPGDVFEIDGYWLPYGPVESAETPARETFTYASDLPEVTSCSWGTILSELPVKIRAEKNKAEFSIRGGKVLLPVIVTGLTDWRNPRIWKKEGNDWRLLSHARNTAHDGYQVFAEEDGTFGAVFLVYSDETEQTLKVSAGVSVEEEPQIALKFLESGVAFSGIDGLKLVYPETESGKSLNWISSEGNSLWFESREEMWSRGGRVSPNQEDLDLEYWWQNNREDMTHLPPEFKLELEGTPFVDPEGERTWLLKDGEWIKAPGSMVLDQAGKTAVAVASETGDEILCMAWPKAHGVTFESGSSIGISLEPVDFSLRHRYHIRGKLYLLQADLDVLKDRINKEITVQ